MIFCYKKASQNTRGVLFINKVCKAGLEPEDF